MRSITKKTYRIYWDHAKPYRLLVFMMLITLLISSVIDIISPILYKRFFDVLASGVLPAVARPQLVQIILILLGLHLFGVVISRISAFSNDFLQPRVMTDLTNTAFEYLHKHSYGFFINRFAGALVRKVNRLASSFEGVADRLYWDLIPLIIKTVGILGVLFYKNIWLGLAMTVWAALFMSLNYALTMYKLKYDIKAAEADTKTTAQLADTIANQVNIKIFAKLKDEVVAFRALTEEKFKISLLSWRIGSFVDGAQAILTTILELGIFYIAIILWTRGVLTVGDFVLIQAYVLQMVWRLWDFGRIFRRLHRDLADAEEMVQILDTPHEIKDIPNAHILSVPNGHVQFKDVSFHYNLGRY